MNLIISGPQGSGKGTQAELLAKKFSLVHLETGEMFRRAAQKKTVFGRKIAHWLNKGILVPDKFVLRLLKQNLTEHNLKRGFILDGSPRNLRQIKWLDKELAKKNSPIDKLILLKISKKESIRRLSERRICPRCSRNFNLLTMPPKKDELCDNCKVKLVTREDETAEAIAKRLASYRRRTAPMVKYYQQKGKVIEINGEQPPGDVFKDILKALE